MHKFVKRGLIFLMWFCFILVVFRWVYLKTAPDAPFGYDTLNISNIIENFSNSFRLLSYDLTNTINTIQAIDAADFSISNLVKGLFLVITAPLRLSIEIIIGLVSFVGGFFV